jgi:hypothetical protein
VFASWQTGGDKKIREGQLQDTKDPVVRAQIKAITNALNRCVPYDGVCWRGLHDLSEDMFNQLSRSAVIPFDAFYSSSKSVDPASAYLKCKKSGTRCLMLKIAKNKTGVDITPISLDSHAHEQEVMLMPGTNYKVLGREERTYIFKTPETVDNKKVWVQNKIHTLELTVEEI